MVDWTRALASGAESGLAYEVGQAKADQDDARWLAREKALDAMHKDDRIETERFLLGLKPPETRKFNVAGKAGPAIQQQEWVPPAAGEDKGHFTNVGDETPDINFERLDETAKHNRESEDAAVERLRLQGEANTARAEAAAARDGAKTGTQAQPKTYTFDGPNGKPIQRVGHFEGGQFVPAIDEHGNPVQAEKYKPSALEEKADVAAKGQRDAVGPSYPKDQFNDKTRKPVSERGYFESDKAKGGPDVAPVFVDPSVAPAGDETPRGTMPQLRPQKAPTSTPASSRGVAPAAKSPYAEGQVIYDKAGKKYVVRNGQPVPA